MIPFDDRSQFPMTTFNPVGISYTISSELWVGVILFPLVIFLKKNANILTLPILIIIIISCLLKINSDAPEFMNLHYAMAYKYVYWGVLRCLMDYSIGIATCIIVLNKTEINKKHRESVIQILCVIAYAYLFLKFNYSRQNELFAPFLFAIFIGSLAKRDGAVFNLTNNKLGNFLGNISYPLYLIHPLFIFIIIKVGNFNPDRFTAVFYMLASILAAYVIHKFIEDPFMAFFKKRIVL